MLRQFVFLLLVCPTLAGAAGGGGYPLDHVDVDVSNQASLQRGAQLFVNYCLACHSAEFQRYNRLARDAGLSDKQVEANLILTADTKVGDTMQNAMPAEDSETWFGRAPPDLSLIARAKGADYLYTYLRTFYLDEERPLGVNNAVLANVGMPHVLWELQGWQKPVYDSHGHGEDESHVLTGFEIVKPGAMSVSEFNGAMRDLVNFLVYISEPAQLQRKRVGIWVLLFISLAFVVFYLLKKEYWKDVH